MRRFLADNEKAIEWLWRLAALGLLLGGAFLQLTYAKREDLVQLRHQVSALEDSRQDAKEAMLAANAVQSSLAREVALLSTQVAVLATQVGANNAQQEKLNARLDRIVDQRAGSK